MELSQNRGQGVLMVARITVEACAAFFITAALLHYGVRCSAVGQWFCEVQLIPAAFALALPVLAIWLGITLLFGRIYCSTVCPLGAMIDLFGRMRPEAKVFRYHKPHNALRNAAFILAACLLATSWLFPRRWLEPFGLYSSIVESITAGSVTLAAVVSTLIVLILAIMAYRRGRLFCNTLCPVGTLLGFFSRRAAFHIDIDTDRCIQCRRCVDVCKAQCINLNDHVADMSRCVVCFNCLPVCPNEAISYTLSRHTLSDPLLMKTPQT